MFVKYSISQPFMIVAYFYSLIVLDELKVELTTLVLSSKRFHQHLMLYAYQARTNLLNNYSIKNSL